MNMGVILQNQKWHDPLSGFGQARRLQAIVAPQQGMTLESFKTNNIEIIAQQYCKPFTRLGCEGSPLIGPYFCQPEINSPFEKNSRGRQIGADIHERGHHKDSDYIPWHYEANGSRISAMLCGADTFNGKPLRDIYGGDFEFILDFDLMRDSLRIAFEVHTELALSSVGIRHHYTLPMGKGQLRFVGSEQGKNEGQTLDLVPDQPVDHAFPFNAGQIELTTGLFRLRIIPEEGIRSVVVICPHDADFVSITTMAGEKPFLPLCHVQKIIVRLETEPLN